MHELLLVLLDPDVVCAVVDVDVAVLCAKPHSSLRNENYIYIITYIIQRMQNASSTSSMPCLLVLVLRFVSV